MSHLEAGPSQPYKPGNALGLEQLLAEFGYRHPNKAAMVRGS
jgi:hypothetical protein